ncbi:MAG: hypothetical protein LBH58_05440 [Tannerellaceae bacterium]|jgi:hypothetical protein|nr:hypothetical protein [Tannerellaceae bacterium]
MLKIKRVVVAGILFAIPLASQAQNNTNSPYTRYGYGELADRSFGAGRAMGGIGYGLRSNKQINPMNPASYTSMDSLTFIFDVGAAGQLSWFDDGVNRERRINGNIDYIALQFPVHRRIAVSAGLLPYSHVGYDYGATKINEGINYSERFYGKGGLNEVYAGLSIDIWKKRLSVGANIGYFFGRITHNQTLSVVAGTTSSTVRIKELEVRDYKLDLGVQYTHPFSATESFTFGAAYSPKKKLNTTSYDIFTDPNGVITEGDTTTSHAFDLPHSIGAGLSYVKQNKLTLATDFLYENWGQARIFDKTNDFKNRIRVAAGGEYIPNYRNRAYFNQVRYRAGIHYSNSYLTINNSTYNEFGASVGLGLPLIDNRSFVNVSFEYVKIKPDSKRLIDQQHFRFTVNYTFNERWFYKFKVD